MTSPECVPMRDSSQMLRRFEVLKSFGIELSTDNIEAGDAAIVHSPRAWERG